MRYLIVIILILSISGCSSNLGGRNAPISTEVQKIEIEKNNIKDEILNIKKEQSGKTERGDDKYKPPYIKDRIKYRCDEYKNDIDSGYICYIESEKYSIATGTGKLAEELSYYKIKEKSTTTWETLLNQ